MTLPDFTLGNAVTHLFKTSGPRGFVAMFALVYGLVNLVIQAGSMWFQWPLYDVYIRMFTEGGGDFEAYADEINAVSMRSNMISLMLLPVFFAVWTVFEGASQRRYMRGEGFGLRLGADEGRLAVVALIWMAMLFAAYIVLVIAVAIPVAIGFAVGGAMAGAIMVFVAMLAAFSLMIWLFGRLSAASALTVRDKEIRFFESWRVTRGHGMRLLGAYWALFLVFGLITLIFYGVIGVLGYVQIAPALAGGGEPDGQAIIRGLSQPGFWGPAAVLVLLLTTLSGAFVHAMGGPGALAARHDPDFLGTGAVPETFN